MEKRDSLLDLDPQIQQGCENAALAIGKMLQGPDFRGKKVLELMSQGMTMSEILGLDEKYLDALFTKAAQLLKAGQIENSRELFRTIVQLQPFDERYTYGFASTFQIEGNYRAAGRLYAYCLTMN